MSPTLPSIEPMSLYQFTYIYQDRSWKYKNHQKANPTKKMPQNKMKSQKKKKKVIRRFYIQYINVVNKSNEIFPKESKMTKEKCMFIRRMFMCVCVCIFFGVVLMTL